jgi:hypothetical protein
MFYFVIGTFVTNNAQSYYVVDSYRHVCQNRDSESDRNLYVGSQTVGS